MPCSPIPRDSRSSSSSRESSPVRRCGQGRWRSSPGRRTSCRQDSPDHRASRSRRPTSCRFNIGVERELMSAMSRRSRVFYRRGEDLLARRVVNLREIPISNTCIGNTAGRPAVQQPAAADRVLARPRRDPGASASGGAIAIRSCCRTPTRTGSTTSTRSTARGRANFTQQQPARSDIGRTLTTPEHVFVFSGTVSHALGHRNQRRVRATAAGISMPPACRSTATATATSTTVSSATKKGGFTTDTSSSSTCASPRRSVRAQDEGDADRRGVQPVQPRESADGEHASVRPSARQWSRSRAARSSSASVSNSDQEAHMRRKSSSAVARGRAVCAGPARRRRPGHFHLLHGHASRRVHDQLEGVLRQRRMPPTRNAQGTPEPTRHRLRQRHEAEARHLSAEGKGAAPVFIFLHGGGFREGDRAQYGLSPDRSPSAASSRSWRATG